MADMSGVRNFLPEGTSSTDMRPDSFSFDRESMLFTVKVSISHEIPVSLSEMLQLSGMKYLFVLLSHSMAMPKTSPMASL